MRPLSDVVGQELVSVEPGWNWFHWVSEGLGGTEHELRLDHDLVAILRFQGQFLSEAEVSGNRWSFEHVKVHKVDSEGQQRPAVLRMLTNRVIRPVIQSLAGRMLMLVRDEESKDVASFSGPTLEFRDGHQVRLQRWWHAFERSEWIWQDETQQLVHLKQHWPNKLAFDIPPTVGQFPEMPLLVVIGWYHILEYWEASHSSA